MIKIKSALYYIFLLCLFWSCSCTNHAPKTETESLNKMRSVWDRYLINHHYDSLVHVTSIYLDQAIKINDSSTACQSGIYLAKAYMSMGKTDSAKMAIDDISLYMRANKSPELEVMMANVLGCYYLKRDLNYSRAFDFFNSGAKWASIIKDPEKEIAMLTSIVYLFYLREDQYGLSYALEAYNLALKHPDIRDFYKCAAVSSLASMYYLSKDLDNTVKFLDKADSIAVRSGYKNYYPIINLIRAELFSAAGHKYKSDSCYKDIMKVASYMEPADFCFTCLRYGQFKEKEGNYDEALNLYRKGLNDSYRTGSNEYRRHLLLAIADLYSKIGKDMDALEYYRQHRLYLDSISNADKEQAFNNQILYVQQNKHNNEIHQKDITIERSVWISSLSALIMISAVVISILVFRSRQKQAGLYKKLIIQYQDLSNLLERQSKEDIHSISTIVSSDTDPENEDKRLFYQLEKLMQEEKVFLQNDISLDKVASILGSNRTYVSKCINTFSGKTFYAYIDMYRIREATRILSSPESSEIPMKELYSSLGYNSSSVFYRSFQRETGVTPGKYREYINS